MGNVGMQVLCQTNEASRETHDLRMPDSRNSLRANKLRPTTSEGFAVNSPRDACCPFATSSARVADWRRRAGFHFCQPHSFDKNSRQQDRTSMRPSYCRLKFDSGRAAISLRHFLPSADQFSVDPSLFWADRTYLHRRLARAFCLPVRVCDRGGCCRAIR